MAKRKPRNLTPLSALEEAAECLKIVAHPYRLRMIAVALEELAPQVGCAIRTWIDAFLFEDIPHGLAADLLDAQFPEFSNDAAKDVSTMPSCAMVLTGWG